MLINCSCYNYFFSQAYYFSAIEKIIGVEINADLCGLQQQIIENYSMADRVEVRGINTLFQLLITLQRLIPH